MVTLFSRSNSLLTRQSIPDSAFGFLVEFLHHLSLYLSLRPTDSHIHTLFPRPNSHMLCLLSGLEAAVRSVFPQCEVFFDALHSHKAAAQHGPGCSNLWLQCFFTRDQDNIDGLMQPHQHEKFFKFFSQRDYASMFPSCAGGVTEGQTTSSVVEGFHASIQHVRAQNSSFTILTSALEVFETRFLDRRKDTLKSERLVIMLHLLEHSRTQFLKTSQAYGAIEPIHRAAAESEVTALRHSNVECESLYTHCKKLSGLNVVVPLMTQCSHYNLTGECMASMHRDSKGCPAPVLSAACFHPRYPEFHALFYMKHLTPKMAAKLNHPVRRARISKMLCRATSTPGIFLVPIQPCSPPHPMSDH